MGYGGYLRDLLFFYGSLCVMVASVRAFGIGAIRPSAAQRIGGAFRWLLVARLS